MFFFFFKQKTAYEMRISDWSSDVCSSDLGRAGTRQFRQCAGRGRIAARARRGQCPGIRISLRDAHLARSAEACQLPAFRRRSARCGSGARSEEHTSELQSLMRISYAVFCLKKKIKKANSTNSTSNACNKLIDER